MGEGSFVILETEPLMLRRQRPSDVEPLVKLWSDPDATRYLGGRRHRAWLRSVFEETAQDAYAERYDLWPVIEKETHEIVGHCGLLEKTVEGRAEIELNYVLVPSAWGKGCATEMGQALKHSALKEIGIDRLIALIEPENGAPERVALKVGMHFDREVVRPGEARRRQCW